jgi:glycosyltransferase involved in cell wall biosynthesis
MPGDIQKNTLLVVSDTAMIEGEEEILVFDPVLREMTVIEDMFDNIIWLGATTLNNKPSLKPVNSSKVKTIMLPCVSRSGFINIFFVLLAYPVILYQVLKYLPVATHVHTRGPSHPAFVAILISLLDKKRIYAHKYAGEWTTNNIPFTYRVQRAILRRIRKNNVRITISGRNSTNHHNVFDLKNPCIYEHELHGMNAAGKAKDFSGDLNLIFVGNMMPSKGILKLLQAIRTGTLSKRYTSLYIVGGGRLLEEVKQQAKSITDLQIVVTGNLSREELNKLYAKAHILILPSSSESFPKVIAEAAAYGCIPVTTNLSAISKQITDGINGFLMDTAAASDILGTLNKVAAHESLRDMSNNAINMSHLFTYEYFRKSTSEVYSIA